MIRVLAIAYGLAALATGQVTVTATPTPAAIARAFLERRYAGVAAWNVAVCATAAGSRASAGQVIQEAAKQGVFLFSPGATDALAVRAVGRSRAQLALDVGEGLSLGGAALTGGNLIKLTDSEKTKAVSTLAIAAGLAHWIATKLQRSAPDPARLRILDLPAEITLPAGGCWTGIALGRDK